SRAPVDAGGPYGHTAARGSRGREPLAFLEDPMSCRALPVATLVFALFRPGPVGAAPFTATEMMKLQRLSDAQVSPGGAWVLYAATDVDIEGSSRNNALWLVPTGGGEP